MRAGVLCSDICGKIYAKVLRQQAAGTLEAVAQDFQMGGIAAKGTDFPSFAVLAWLQQCARDKVLGAVLFVDIRAAFYATAPEVVLGAMLCQPARRTALAHAGLLPSEVEALEQP